MDVELLDAHVFGEGEFGHEGFILSFVVGNVETAVDGLLDQVPLR